MMSSVCFDIVVPPVFTCYVYKFYETKTNNYLKHISCMQTKGLRIYNIFLYINMYNSNQLCIEFEQRAKRDSRELNLQFQTPSFLYHSVNASSLGYKY